jgi:chemotaxis protein methyltransferase CheR
LILKNKLQAEEDWTIEGLASYLAEIVSRESYNILDEKKLSMVQSRVAKRIITLDLKGPNEYYHFFSANYEKELSQLVSLLTTHHTFFFREFFHFQFILEHLDEITQKVLSRGERKIRVLSAACSRGQEVYSLAMFFDHHLKRYPGISYEIVGYDIDEESIKIAKNGVYPYQEVKSIPKVYLGDHWQRGTGEIKNYAKIKPKIKKHCLFSTDNILSKNINNTRDKFDIIFCRNVFIYFDQSVIKESVLNLKKKLCAGGFLFTGVSESLKNIDIELNGHGPSIYTFGVDEKKSSKIKNKTVLSKEEKVDKSKITIPSPIKVLIVDDSKSVLKLLTKVFENDLAFELVGTASNGLEAEEFLKNNTVDAMTLDIHMPEMDGVEYLRKNFKNGHPHVVIVSSASREDTRYAQKTLEYGASDFVEKPALNNIKERSEEIKNKIKMSFFNNIEKNNVSKTPLDSFQKKFEIKNCENKARFFVTSFSQLKKLEKTLKELEGKQPPIFIFFEGGDSFLEIFKTQINTRFVVEIFKTNLTVRKDTIYLCSFSKDFEKVNKILKGKRVSVGVFGLCSERAAENILDLENIQLLLEDTEGMNNHLKEVATDIFPTTSFAHVGTEYLCGNDTED